LSMPAMTAAAASSVSSWRAALSAADPIDWDAVYVYAVCIRVIPRRAHLRILGEERLRACAVGVPLAVLELECAAIEVEAPFLSSSAWTAAIACSGAIVIAMAAASSMMAPTTSATVPPSSRSAPRSQSRWGLNHMQSSAGPSGQPCCVPPTEAKSAHVAPVASGALGPRRAQTKGVVVVLFGDG
jgi:hypothetical protein